MLPVCFLRPGCAPVVRSFMLFCCTDRKKDLVKLQAGEYVSLGKVETSLKLCPLVDNVCLYAESTKDYTVALAVPNRKNVENLARQLGITSAVEFDDLCTNPAIEKAVLVSLNEYGTKG